MALHGHTPKQKLAIKKSVKQSAAAKKSAKKSPLMIRR